MCRRLIFLSSFVLVLGLTNGALAGTYTWTNGAVDNNSWCNYLNWTPDTGPPGSADTALIGATAPNRGPIIGTDCGDVDVQTIQGPEPAYGNTQVIDVNTGGTVTVSTWIWRNEEPPSGAGTAIININGSPTITIGGNYWRGPDNALGILNISGNPTIDIAGQLRGADEGGSSFIINMSGGLLKVGDELILGDGGGGELNVSGGSIDITEHLNLGGDRGSDPITVNVTDGLIRVAGQVQFPGSVNRAGAVRINLYGGVIDCNEFVHGGSDVEDPTYTDDWRLDIEEGMLKIKGDLTAAIDANVAAGQITAYNGDSDVVVEFIDGNTVVTAKPPDPNLATNPNPDNGEEWVDPNVVFGWTAGINAADHNIFFGKSFEDVNNMTDPCATKNLGEEEYYPGPLELLTTYYWRVDEVNDGNNWKGKVWHFTTRGAAIDPNLLVWYKFDEPDGYFAYDSSGRGYHGAVGGPEELWDPCNGHDGGSRIFDDNGDEETVVDVPTAVLSNIDGGITVLVWLKDSFRKGDDNWVFDTGAGGETGPYHVLAAVPTEDKDTLWRAGNDSNDLLRWNLGGRDPSRLEGWHFWAFVKDENAGTMKIYFDGEEAASKTGTISSLSNVQDTSFKIGAATWSQNYDFVGKMDDFRVYDYGLSATEIAELFRGEGIELAWGPKPGNFEEDVPRDANLAWKPGEYAADVNAHQLYFGTDYVSVRDANTTVTLGVYKGDQNETTYDLPILDLETIYYWRIDEVNGPCTWPGPVWKFTVASFLVVDDFESYNYSTKKIEEMWWDYYQQYNNGLPITCSWLLLGEDPYDIVHRGSQSMRYIYDMVTMNGECAEVCYAEAWLPIPTGQQDWTREDVKILRLYFYGDSDNDTNGTERMYVGVEDGDGNYAEVRYGEYNSEEEDMNDLKIEEWQKWDIGLAHFNDTNYASVANDVNLEAIAKLYIGFGDRRDPPELCYGCAGKGVVIFDDIHLHLPVCVPKYGPVGDFSGDCTVGIADVGIMAEHWLLTDSNFGSAIEKPDDANLLGWWKLDDGSGNTAADDSGYGNDGTIEGCCMWVPGHNDVNTALKFRKIGGWVLVPDDGDAPELRPRHKVSACAWVYYSVSQDHSARIVVKGKNDKETFAIEVSDEDRCSFSVRDANNLDEDGDYKRYDVNGPVWHDDWIHLAGTYDGSSVKCYVNGRLMNSRDDANDPNFLLSQDANGLAIGNMADANEKEREKEFIGTIDDVRVYDYALSAAEVAWLASDGAGYVGLAAPFNLYDKEPVDQQAINFRDFAVLLESWLDEKKWP